MEKLPPAPASAALSDVRQVRDPTKPSLPTLTEKHSSIALHNISAFPTSQKHLTELNSSWNLSRGSFSTIKEHGNL